MDKTLEYQQILQSFLEECAATPYSRQPELKKQIIADTERNHFQLMTVGWYNDTYTCKITFHFDIIEGKVWIQENNTELQIADELIDRGVLKSDIVMGFYPPYARAYSGFAVA